MLKDLIIELLDTNKDIIKKSFKIENDEINNIKKFLSCDYKDFSDIIDEISISNLSDRAKMVACYMIGYVNGNKAKEGTVRRYEFL